MKILKGVLAGLAVWAISEFAVVVCFALASGENPPDIFFIFLLLAMVVLPLIPSVFVFKKVAGKLSLQVKSEKNGGVSNGQTASERRLINSHGKLQLVGGLIDLPEGTICKVVYNTDKIVFTASGQEFTLNASKMIDVSVMTPKEIQTQYVSSVGGAVAGAVLLGPLGAIIGGTASKKQFTTKRKYLIFTYLSDGETKYIVFDVTTRPADGNRIKSTYRFLKKSPKIQVDL